jgi:hypothetical protein
MSYDYASRFVLIESLHDVSHPMAHDLCTSHADRLTPPSGWELIDDRP